MALANTHEVLVLRTTGFDCVGLGERRTIKTLIRQKYGYSRSKWTDDHCFLNRISASRMMPTLRKRLFEQYMVAYLTYAKTRDNEKIYQQDDSQEDDSQEDDDEDEDYTTEITEYMPGEVVGKLMAKMGWKFGEGLGLNSNGISNPIQLKYQMNRKGLGYNVDILEEEN